jgi:hypothetical protein
MRELKTWEKVGIVVGIVATIGIGYLILKSRKCSGDLINEGTENYIEVFEESGQLCARYYYQPRGVIGSYCDTPEYWILGLKTIGLKTRLFDVGEINKIQYNNAICQLKKLGYEV